MHGIRRLPLASRLLLATVAALVAIAAGGSGPVPTIVAAIPHWTGSVDLYRSGVFTTQKTWLWCTAADVQIIRNIADRAADHSRSSQQRYFTAMRAHNRYAIPVSDGVDPAGWTYGLRHFVDSRYRLVASGSFNAALRSAVTNLRKTNLPVGITVARGNHAWILTGFTATADPAVTTRFTVTSVRVVGPLWGLQSRSYGYDMRPDTKLTPKQLAGFFSPWHYAKIRMAWEGDWVSIQPIAARTAAIRSAPMSTAATGPAEPVRPKPSARSIPAPLAAAANASPSRSSSPRDVGLAGGVSPAGSSGGGVSTTAAVRPGGSTEDARSAWIVAAVVAAMALAVAIAGAGVRRRNARVRRRPTPG